MSRGSNILHLDGLIDCELNPLKVIAESIDNWRKVNLERDKITHDTELERMRIQAQQETEKLRRYNLS